MRSSSHTKRWGQDTKNSMLHDSVLVTGSSGFIGSHVSGALLKTRPQGSVYGLDIAEPNEPDGLCFVQADIRNAVNLRGELSRVRPDIMIHLAALAEVVIPFQDFRQLLETNVEGTLNLLNVLEPKVVLFASTSAVYGNARAAGAPPSWTGVSPLGIYGMSKAVAEMIGRDWATETGGVFLHFRFGNIVGPRCRGLIPYLVNHAKRNLDGSPAAQLRGQGRLVRDYVPVEYLIQLFEAAMQARWPPGTSATFNVGTGRGTTNRAVAGIVQRFLRSRGYKLNMQFNNPAAAGESATVVLDMKSTVRRLAVPPPDRRAVIRSIEEATLSFLETKAE
jgi:nucleoside-diphosphate-sugar epimerase